MTDTILKAGCHTVIAGITSQNQSGVSRELVFNALVSERRPTIIVLTDVRRDDTFTRQFSIWAKARARAFTKQQILVCDALQSTRDADDFFALIDKVWKLRPSPSPTFYRDMSGDTFKRDRWIDFAPELAAMWHSPVLTCANLGPHPLASISIQEIAADAHWECVDYGAQVRLKHIESGEAVQFTPKPVHGGRVWNIEKQENSHAA